MPCYFNSGHKGKFQKVEVKGPTGRTVLIFEGEICDRDAAILRGGAQ